MLEQQSDAGIGRRITRYGTILAVSGILCKILLLVYTVWALEILGKEGFGRIEYFIEMAIIFSVLIDFGLEQTITREVARRRDQVAEILRPLTIFRIIASLAGAGALALFLSVTAKEGHSWPLILAALTYFFIVTNVMLVRAIVRSFEWLSYEGLANVLDKIVHIGLAFLALIYLPLLPLIVLCYSAGALVSLLIYAYVVARYLQWQRQPFTWRFGMDWQRLAFPIGLSAACILLLHREDTVMVNWIRGDEETGLYRAPYRFLEGLFLFPQVMAIAAYPVFSKLFHENRLFSQTAGDLLRGLMMLSLPISVGGTIIAGEMMMSLTPELGPEGGWVFRILIWSLPFIYANFLLGTILNATNRQNQNLYASFAGLVSNALLNIPAIYYWGAFGASVMTIFSQSLYCLIMLYYLRGYDLIQNLRSYGAILASCIVMALLLYWGNFQWIVAILIGGLIYAITLVLLRGVSMRDLENLKRVVRK